jgi:hypothetical protein
LDLIDIDEWNMSCVEEQSIHVHSCLSVKKNTLSNFPFYIYGCSI